MGGEWAWRKIIGGAIAPPAPPVAPALYIGTSSGVFQKRFKKGLNHAASDGYKWTHLVLFNHELKFLNSQVTHKDAVYKYID